jgi:hypothetical protein
MVIVKELLQAPLSENDLEFDMPEHDKKCFAEFEAAWETFLRKNPNKLPVTSESRGPGRPTSNGG